MRFVRDEILPKRKMLCIPRSDDRGFPQRRIKGFTKKYNINKLVYFEIFDDPENAITKEKAIKNLVRRKKDQLINASNPEWKELYQEILSG